MRYCFYGSRTAGSVSRRLLSAVFLLQLLLCVGAPVLAQNNIQIHGIITNQKGEPVGGASITEKGTSNGTVSLEDGKFTLSVAGKKSILLISFTGYANQELMVGNNASLNITLQPDGKSMNEVIVVGYGSQKKATLTGSVATVKGTDIAKSNSVNVSNALAGRIPGVIANNRSGRPGDDGSSIYIRGFNSFSGGTSPLILVDGIPDRSISRLNPNDIESITVLKDASAAIYGVRAANGVILVTTKRGKSGAPGIQYEGTYGIQQLTRLPKTTNSWEYMTWYNEVKPGTFAQAEIDKYKAGNDPNYTSTDWLNEVFRKSAPQTSHAVSVSGGNENVKYYFSGQYTEQSSNFKNSIERYKQFNFRSNIDARISKNLKVNLDIGGRQEDRTYPYYSVGSILHETRSMYPYVPARWANGLPSAGLAGGRNPILMTSGEPGYDRIKNYVINPLAGFELKMPFITQGLALSGYFSYDLNLRHQKVFNKPFDNYFYDKTTGAYSNNRSATGIPSIVQDESLLGASTQFIKLSYERQFGLHNINTFVGYEATTNNNWGTYAYRKNLLSDQIDQIFTGSTEGQLATGSASQDGRASYLGRIQYDYDSKYLAEVTMRYNGSFNFPTNNRWGLFPAVILGWRISEEKFFKNNVKFIEQLKLRASWGLMGSDAVAQYLFLTRYQMATNSAYFTYFGDNFQQAPSLVLSSTPNENITWEKQDTRNIGFDATLLNGHLNISADYFRYLRSDILAKRNASIPIYTGMSLPNENIGRTLNRGFDFSINYSNNAGEFMYNIGVNGTFAKSKILFSDEATTVPEWQKSEGHPIDSWMLYQTAGIYRSQAEIDKSIHLPGAKVGDIIIIDRDGNKEINANDMVRSFESATPKMVYGIILGGQWRGFSVNMVWAGQAMAKQTVNPQAQSAAMAPAKWQYDNRYTADNPNSLYPRAYSISSPNSGYYNSSDFWLRSAAFLRLKTLELSYNIPSKIYSKYGVNSLRVFASGYNLISFDKMKKYDVDPETNNTTGVNYPQTRIFRFGINVGL